MKKTLSTLFKKNIRSGITIGMVSIPLALSLAVASGTTPSVGIITAIWAGLIASIFGGSNYNIIGPTGALSGLLVSYAALFGAESLSMLAILAGAFILCAYLFRLERYLIFIPASALHGFTLGVAFIIILSQLPAMLGVCQTLNRESGICAEIQTFWGMLTHMHVPSFVLCILILMGLLIFSRYFSKIPGAIVFTVIGAFVGYLSTHGIIPWQLQTLGTKYPSMKFALFSLPHFSIHMSYLLPALSLATIAILETMISARIADGITKTRHNQRKEMFGLGLSNVVCGFTGGIPATAALARTSLNIKNGCTHKISATISTIALTLIAFLFLDYLRYLPLAVVAAILIFVALQMIEMEHFIFMYKVDKKSLALTLLVAFITIYEDATIGILLGSVIAMLIFMQKVSTGYHEISTKGKESGHEIPSGMPTSATTVTYTIKGVLAYINAQAHIMRLERISANYTDIVLNLHDVYFIDLDGVEAFGDIVETLTRKGKQVWVVGLNPIVELMLKNSTKYEELHKAHHIITG